MTAVDTFLAEHGESLVAFRRDLHAHPELGWQEHRTTDRIIEELSAAGLAPRRLPRGTGVFCDVGPSPVVGLRADIDALPVTDGTAAPYRSTVDGVCHACGHDVHATVVAGTGRYLARLAPAGHAVHAPVVAATGRYLAGLAAAGALPRGVQLLFQPAEELMPGGALDR